MLCYTIQGALFELIFLAEPHQPNGYDGHFDLVDFPEGYEMDTPITHGHPWHGPTMYVPMTLTLAMTMVLIAMALVAKTLTSGPGVLCIWETPALFYEMARLATVVVLGS